MLLTKEVEVKLCYKNIDHYNDLGYKGKNGETIIVKIGDLTKGSHVIVDVLCDYCKTKILHITYKDYNNRINKTGTCACSECKFIKARETNKVRYGFDNPFQNESVKAKFRENNLQKYGVEYPSQLKEVREKVRKTSIERYGVDNYAKTKECQDKKRTTNKLKYGAECSFQNEEVKAKFRENNLQKYGVENPMQLKEVQEKTKQTCLKKYGVENPVQNEYIKNKITNTLYERYGVFHPMQLELIRERWAKSMFELDITRTSKQQIYLHNLYGGELNYPISYYLADICFPDEKIDIEYNGGGHNLCVKTGQVTQNEFNQKEYYRDITIKSEGYKIMTIISSKDYLPSDEILLQMLEQARTYFNTTTHTWIEYNIDTSIMRNAENKNGVYFDFGDLRKIKQAS